MVQQQLFDAIATSRKSDPATSHDAAAKVESSGRAGSDRARLLEAVRHHPGHTAGELAMLDSVRMERSEVSKRLPELRKMGLVKNGEARECFARKSRMLTWWPV